MNTRVVLDTIFNAERHLSSQSVISSIDWHANDGRVHRVNEHLSADDAKDSMPLGVFT